MSDFALTTVDNPYHPVTQFDQWLAEDIRLGYNTLSLLGRIIVTSDALSIADQELAYDLAVNEIVEENVSGVHRKIEIPDDSEVKEVR